MIRLLLFATLLSSFLAPSVSFAALLASSSPGNYSLYTTPDGESGSFFPETLLSRQSANASGYQLAAAEHKVGPRLVELGVWAGAKANTDQYLNAWADESVQVVVLPEEGEASGNPITLYVQLTVRPFSGNVDFPTAPSASALIANAVVWSRHGGPIYSFSGPGQLAFQAKIGVPFEMYLFASALAQVGPSAQSYRYAAMDMQLVLGFEAGSPTPLTPLPTIPGDATLDGVVDGADYTVWADGYLQTTSQGGWRGDFNRDGYVDGVDYTIWSDHFSPSSLPTPAISAVPEPSTWLLATVGTLCGVSVRRFLSCQRR